MKRRINIKRIVMIFFLLLCIFIYSSDYLILDLPEYYLERIYEKSNIRLWPRYFAKINIVFRFFDEINVFYVSKDLLDGTFPILNIQLTVNDLSYIENSSSSALSRGFMANDINDWRNARLEYDNENYDIKFKLHGDMAPHWDARLKSFKIKGEKERYIFGIKNFNLIIFEDRFLKAKITRELARDFGLLDIRDELVVLKINGIVQGVYYLQEKLDERFLEFNNCSNCLSVSISDNLMEDHPQNGADMNGIFLNSGHYTLFDYEIANLDGLRDEMSVAQIDKLYKSLKSKNSSELFSFFDLDYLSSFEALRMIVGNSHMVTGDNLRMVYSQTDAKFYPVPINEVMEKLRLNRGGLENHLSNHDGYIVELIEYWTKNPELRFLKYKKVYEYISDNDLLLNVENLTKFYLDYVQSYKTNDFSRRYINREFSSYESILNYNFRLIKNNLEYSKVYVNGRIKDNELNLEIIPDTTSYLSFSRLNLTLPDVVRQIQVSYNDELHLVEPVSETIDLSYYLKDLLMTSELDDDLNPIPKSFFVKIKLIGSYKIDDILNLQLGFRNEVTNKDVDLEDIYFSSSNENNFFDRSFLDYFKDNLSYSGKRLFLSPGDYLISQNLFVPKGYELVLEAGTNLKMLPNISIVSFSPINIQGVETDPVVIQAFDKTKPFGVFGVVGNGDEVVNISWLKLSGGSERWIDGFYFSGALSIHHMDVNLFDSEIFGNYADDGLNIKYSEINLKNNLFRDNFADQVDLDFCEGLVVDSVFRDAGIDDNGDGLDLSGSSLMIKDNLFEGFKDKGVSVGEKTNLFAYENIFKDNLNGVAVKDLSNVYLINNEFVDSINAINAYQKKPMYGGGTFYVYGNDFFNVENQFLLDKESEQFNLDLKLDELNLLDSFVKNNDVDGVFSLLEGVGVNEGTT